MAIIKDDLLINISVDWLQTQLVLPTGSSLILQQIINLNALFPKEYLFDVAISVSLKFFAQLKSIMQQLKCPWRLDKILPEPKQQCIRAVAYDRRIFTSQFLNSKSGGFKLVDSQGVTLTAGAITNLSDYDLYASFFKADIIEKAKKKLVNEDVNRKVEFYHRFLLKDGRISLFFQVTKPKMEAKKPAKESVPGAPATTMSPDDKEKDTKLLNHIKAINKEIKKLKQNIDVLNLKRNLKRNQPSKDNEGFTIVGLDQENINHLKSLKEELLKKERELDLSSRERRYIQNQVAKLDAVPAKHSLDFASREVKSARSHIAPDDNVIVLISDPGKVYKETVGVQTYQELACLSNVIHLNYEHELNLHPTISSNDLPAIPSATYLQVVASRDNPRQKGQPKKNSTRKKANILKISARKMKKASSPVDNRKLENGQSFHDYNESLKDQGNLKNTGTMEALETLQENKRATKVLFIQAMAQKEAEDYAHKCRYLKNQAQANAVFALYRMGREYFFSKLPGDSPKRVVDASTGLCSNCNHHHLPVINSKGLLSYDPICEREGVHQSPPIKVLFIKGAMSHGEDYVPGNLIN